MPDHLDVSALGGVSDLLCSRIVFCTGGESVAVELHGSRTSMYYAFILNTLTNVLDFPSFLYDPGLESQSNQGKRFSRARTLMSPNGCYAMLCYAMLCYAMLMLC